MSTASETVDDYELTPAYSYHIDEKTGEVVTDEAPWTVRDNEGTEVYSLLPPPVVVSLLHQLVGVLKL